jgi:hypothetical protein
MTTERPIHLLPTTSRVHAPELEALHPSGLIVACDFYVEGIERGEEVVGGYRMGRILNLDHHAPTPRMARPISSTNLALEWVAAGGARGEEAVVLLNHTDCDSVLSGAIAAGRLPLDPAFGEAAIAADHTGEQNPVADLLQALDRGHDLEFALKSLDALLSGRALEGAAADALERRRRERGAAEALVEGGRFERAGKLAFAILEAPVPGEFFPALLPDAAVILTTSPLRRRPGYWQVRLRLGRAAPAGLTLERLEIGRFDPHYGGRWNAGSNRRAGGTGIEPQRYAELLAERLGVVGL